MTAADDKDDLIGTTIHMRSGTGSDDVPLHARPTMASPGGKMER